MRVYAKDIKRPAKVHDLETGKDIAGVIWVDESAGQAEAYHHDASGDKVLAVGPDGTAAWKTVLLKGRFKLVMLDRRDDSALRKRLGADKCGRCASRLTLPGDELCPACKRLDMGKPIQLERCGAMDGHRCERCSRDAVWQVVDEVAVSPQQATLKASAKLLGGLYLFDRGVTVGRRFYCDAHWRGPRILDYKGDIIVEEQSQLNPDTVRR